MDDKDWYSQESRSDRALEKTREDFHDLQNELAGRDTGKISRFTSEEERERRTGRAGSEKASATCTQLQLLLSQPDYAEDYNNVMNMLMEAEYRTQLAIDQTEQDLNQNDQELDDIQSRASTLPDGTRVYRDEGGNVFNEDGEQVHAPETDSIVWRDDNPSYEDYLTNRERDAALREYLNKVRDYQISVLGYIRGRMADPDNPPSPDEVNGFEGFLKSGPEELAASIGSDSNPDNDLRSSLSMAPPQL